MPYTELKTHPTTTHRIDCTGDAVAGDHIRWTEAVFSGSYRRPRFAGGRDIEAEIVKDAYGADKQQHTFTLLVIASSGTDAPEPGSKIKRKGRSLYKNGCYRMVWADESARVAAADEKHGRGDAARSLRDHRREMDGYNVRS